MFLDAKTIILFRSFLVQTQIQAGSLMGDQKVLLPG